MGIAYMREVMEGIRAAQREMPWLVVAVRDVSRKAMELLPELVHDLRVEGVLGFFARPSMVGDVLAAGLPALTVSDYLLSPQMPSVVVDNTAVGRAGADHLIARGLKHFAYLSQPTGFSQKRQAGFSARLAEMGAEALTLEHRQIPEAASAMLALPGPVGVLCCSDVAARELVDELIRREAQVPDQIAVLGVDNAAEYCESGMVSVSSISLNGQEVGRRAIATLLGMIEGQAIDFPVQVPPGPVIERESTQTISTRLPGVADAIRFIRTHACEGIDVSDVVRASGLSRATIDRHIRAALGHSPHHEIRMLQLERARQLLRETNLEVHQIAQRCGFNEPQYFFKVFRKHHQQTPTQFRRNQSSAAHAAVRPS